MFWETPVPTVVVGRSWGWVFLSPWNMPRVAGIDLNPGVLVASYLSISSQSSEWLLSINHHGKGRKRLATKVATRYPSHWPFSAVDSSGRSQVRFSSVKLLFFTFSTFLFKKISYLETIDVPEHKFCVSIHFFCIKTL